MIRTHLISHFAPNAISISVEPDLVHIGNDPEYADLDNPRGEIWSERYFLTAYTTEGIRFRHFHGFVKEAEATSFARHVDTALYWGHRLSPEYWDFFGCVYGSDAYQEFGGERDLIEWERGLDSAYF